jgi:hypothetical protein
LCAAPRPLLRRVPRRKIQCSAFDQYASPIKRRGNKPARIAGARSSCKGGANMETLGKGFGVLSRALRWNGFHKAGELGIFVTFVRDGDLLKIHVGPDGSFSAFNTADECITEGKGFEDLYRVLVAKPACPTLRLVAGRCGARRRARSWSGGAVA